MTRWGFRDILYPALFGLSVLLVWQAIVRGFGVPAVLLPAPTDIWIKMATSLPTLWIDFVQTFVRAVIPGWIIGSAAGFLTAIACDRVPFLGRGLLPLGNLVAALPIVGVAPIMVMWFGFDWQSKAAMVVVMTFFPMLVNAVTGLQAASHLERDLMRSYGASWRQTLFKLRLPAAMPFVFNALKINATLGLIGAIELSNDKARRSRFASPGRVGTMCRDNSFKHGLIMRACWDTMVFAPPFCITREEIDQMVTRARAALADRAPERACRALRA